MEKCIFCDLKTHEIIYEGEYCVIVRDQFPVSPGHLLIIPKRHVHSIFDLNKEEIDEITEDILVCKRWLDYHYHPDGYNIGTNINAAAGQSVPHCHIHVIPRYEGDVENPRGGVRGVIPSKQNY